jgi:F-type H+-transporting ATPase subunit b
MNAMELDLSVLVVMILVWSLYFVLKKSFFDPINQILLQRNAETNGAQQEARERLTQVDQKSQAYQQALKAARLESYRQQESFRSEALKQRLETLTETRQEAEGILHSAKEEIQSQVAGAKRSLESEVNGIADGIVKAILR